MINEALKAIESYKSNAIIMNFVNTESLKKVAAEISANPSRVCTPADIEERVADYVRLGLIGIYMAAQ